MNYNQYRRHTVQVMTGHIAIGGNAPLSVQSMTNTDPHNFDATFKQVLSLQEAGCDIIRLTVPDKEAARVIAKIKDSGKCTVPLVADIHFDYRVVLDSLDAGVDKIRINPGNIGDKDRVHTVAKACREKKVPIRIGVNSGSLEKEILSKYGSPTPEALAESALYHARLLEEWDFNDIVISIKSSSVQNMVAANRIVAERCQYPLHIGITESGTISTGLIKSAAGIGALLCDGIGDTIRVSLTADPLVEVETGKQILSALGLGAPSVNVISCPSCGRTKINLFDTVERFEQYAKTLHPKSNITVAIMGCAVNGPGEAREADIGIAGGIGEYLLFRRGEIICKVKADQAFDVLVQETQKLL